jgi:signal transduction histidine kinase
VVEESLSLLNVEAKWNDVAVHLELQPDVPSVTADRILVEQVILNLARNGLEAMQDIPVQRRRLTVRTRGLEGARVEVSVEDAGKGLSEAALDRIFEPFFTTKPDGLGLGLAISRSIIENHGGQLCADAVRGGGATFRFTLPCAGPRDDG